MEAWMIITLVLVVAWIVFDILNSKQKKKIKEHIKEREQIEISNSDCGE